MIQIYTFYYKIGDYLYSGRIPARSWEEAQQLVPFAVVDGVLEEVIPW